LEIGTGVLSKGFRFSPHGISTMRMTRQANGNAALWNYQDNVLEN
jgi:hypothetical protein